jgi:hypothetical protein
MIDRRTGVDGKAYGIRFAARFPITGAINICSKAGGLNGTVAELTGAQEVGDQPALARGFAVSEIQQIAIARHPYSAWACGARFT